MTGLKLLVLVAILLPQFALSKTTKEQVLAADIGGISELNGSAQIVRDKPLNAEVDFAIQSNDEAVTTSISPLDKPKASGKRIIKLRPNSSTVAVKSVPRIAMSAVGVDNFILLLFILFRLLLINLAVPRPKVRAIFALDGSGSYMYSFIVNLECSVNFTIESSRNVIAILPSVVIASSLLCIANFKSAS